MFSKKIVLLKQTAEGYSTGKNPLCCICRLEKDNELLTVFLSPIGFASLNQGEYRLFIVGDDKTVASKNLGKSPTSAATTATSELSLELGVSAGIWTVKDDIPLLIAYQKTDDAKMTLKEYGATVAGEIIAERKLREREKEFATERERKTPPAPSYAVEPQVIASDAPFSVYDDEAVATVNYYDESEDIKRKLDRIRELKNEYFGTENDDGDSDRRKAEKESQENAYSYQNEKDDESVQNAPYYETVKSELDGIFERFPAETELQKVFTDCKFAKVSYGDGKFYVVGVVKEDGKEKYICYGVPSVYRETPPVELAGYCSFVPLSVFDLKGDGYFMMFQDAYTGKCVHK